MHVSRNVALYPCLSASSSVVVCVSAYVRVRVRVRGYMCDRAVDIHVCMCRPFAYLLLEDNYLLAKVCFDFLAAQPRGKWAHDKACCCSILLYTEMIVWQVRLLVATHMCTLCGPTRHALLAVQPILCPSFIFHFRSVCGQIHSMCVGMGLTGDRKNCPTDSNFTRWFVWQFIKHLHIIAAKRL